MKKLEFAILFSAAAVLAAACQVIENETPAPVKPVEQAYLNAFAEQPAPETKTSLGEGDLVLWSEGDQIAVFGQDALDAAAIYTIASEAGQTSASFTGDAVTGENKLAVYPASAVASEAAASCAGGVYTVPVTIPATQTYVEGSFPNEANLAVAYGADDLYFYNAMGVIELQLYASSTRTVNRIQLAAAEPLAGDATLTFDPESAEPVLEFTGNTTKVITIDLGDGFAISKDADAPTVIYAVVPAGALAGGFTILVDQKDTGISALLRTTKDNAIKRSVIKEMPAAQASFTINFSKIANTYIVEPGTSVNIYPVRPDGILPGHVKAAGASVSATFNVSSATPVSKEIGVYTTYVKYTANENEGKVGISISDKSGYIWTYIAWVTDTPEDIILSDGTVLMDRNLGATAASYEGASAAQTQGFTFQWGRKDPVISVSTTAVATSETVGTEAYVIAHPNAFITAADGTANTNDWHWTGNNKLWGATKTVWDPCPAGYRVPDGGTSSFWATCDFATNKGTYDSTNNGYNFAVLDGGDSAWFPRFTYYDQTGKAYAGGNYWCYNSVSMTGGYYNGRLFKFTSSSVSNSSNTGRASSGAIRCQKIQ